jgi:hypothetical protein
MKGDVITIKRISSFGQLLYKPLLYFIEYFVGNLIKTVTGIVIQYQLLWFFSFVVYVE